MIVCSKLKLKLDAFVDMGSRLGSTKHVLVSVVVQMTDNLVISLACCPEFTIITWFRPFNGELACCDIPGVVIRSTLNGRLHVMFLTFCLQPQGPGCMGHVWQHPSNLLVLRSPVLTPQKRSYFSLAHLGLPSLELAFAKEQCR